MNRGLISTVTVDRIRRRHERLLKQAQAGLTPQLTELGPFLTDVQKLLDSYETATTRITGAVRGLEGDR